MSQQCEAPLTPRQRWIFMQLALSPDAVSIKTSAEGKAFRRALRALGMTPIRDAIGRGNTVSDALAESRQPALFKLTLENVDTALTWAAVPRHPSLEMDCGEAFDLLEQLRADPASWTPPPGLPAYDPAAEDWRPEGDSREAVDLLELIVDDPHPVPGWKPADWERAQHLVDRRRLGSKAP